MKDDVAQLGVKTIATGFTAAFGLTPWALAAALVGAIASLHFEKEAQPGTVWKLLGKILALSFLAALLSASIQHIPGFAWTDNIPVALRAGFFGIFANSAYELVRIALKWFGARFNVAGG